MCNCNFENGVTIYWNDLMWEMLGWQAAVTDAWEMCKWYCDEERTYQEVEGVIGGFEGAPFHRPSKIWSARGTPPADCKSFEDGPGLFDSRILYWHSAVICEVCRDLCHLNGLDPDNPFLTPMNVPAERKKLAQRIARGYSDVTAWITKTSRWPPPWKRSENEG